MSLTSTAAPHVGIVLLNWNGWRDTVECLESLMRLEYGAFTVVVCDQASADDSVARIRDWAAGRLHVSSANPKLASLTSSPLEKPVRLVELARAEAEAGGSPISGHVVMIHVGDNLGTSGGNNVGIRYLLKQDQVKYVWILNNDIVVAPDALTELVAVAERTPNVGGVSGKLLDYRQTDELQAAGGGFLDGWRGFPTAAHSVELLTHADGSTEARLDWLTGGNILSPSAVFRDVGLLDEDYFLYMEDVEHCLRMKRLGYRFAYAERSRVWHKGGATTGHASPRYDYYMTRNALMVTKRHRPRMLSLVMAYTTYRCVLPKVARGQGDRLRATLRAIRDFRRGVTGRAPF